MIKLCCEYLSVRCIWLYVIIMSRTHLRVNPHSTFAWISRNSLLLTVLDLFHIFNKNDNNNNTLIISTGINNEAKHETTFTLSTNLEQSTSNNLEQLRTTSDNLEQPGTTSNNLEQPRTISQNEITNTYKMTRSWIWTANAETVTGSPWWWVFEKAAPDLNTVFQKIGVQSNKTAFRNSRTIKLK